MRVLLTMTLLLAGCSEVDRGSGGDAAWSQYCDTTGPERAMRCGDIWEPADTTECNQFATCIRPSLRADLRDDIPACLAGRACGMNDDGCFTAEGVGATGSSASAAFQAACLNRRAECEEEGESFSDDFCFSNIASDTVIRGFSDCLPTPCATMRTCLDAVIPDCG